VTIFSFVQVKIWEQTLEDTFSLVLTGLLPWSFVSQGTHWGWLELRHYLTHPPCAQASNLSPVICEINNGCSPTSSLPLSTSWRKAGIDHDDVRGLYHWPVEMTPNSHCRQQPLLHLTQLQISMQSHFMVLFLLCILECSSILLLICWGGVGNPRVFCC